MATVLGIYLTFLFLSIIIICWNYLFVYVSVTNCKTKKVIYCRDISKILCLWKIIKRDKIDTYDKHAPHLTSHNPCFLFAPNKFYRSKTSLLMKWCGHTSAFHMSKLPTLTYNRAKSVVLKKAIILKCMHNE